MNAIRISILRMCSLCVFTHNVEVYYEDEKMLIKHNTENLPQMKSKDSCNIFYVSFGFVKSKRMKAHTTALHANCSVKIHTEDETRRAE